MVNHNHLKILVPIAALVAGLVIGGGSGRAATGGTLSQFATDPAITSSATGVTSSQAFPDGTTSAACLIKVDATGAQTHTFGNCTGLSVNASCASGAFSTNPAADA